MSGFIGTNNAPAPSDLAHISGLIFEDIMDGGAKKNGEHIWWTQETVRHHADRVIRHLCTAMILRQSGGTDDDGENAMDHAERALTRLAFVVAKMREWHE